MAACANFVVEGAVDFICFCAEDGGKVVGHDCGRTVERTGVDLRVGSRTYALVGCRWRWEGLLEFVMAMVSFSRLISRRRA